MALQLTLKIEEVQLANTTAFLNESEEDDSVPLELNPKFNSPQVNIHRQDSNASSERSMISTENSVLIRNTTTFSMGVTHLDEYEESKITNSIVRYNELQIKLVVNDPLKHSINGVSRRWKAGKALGFGSMGQVIEAFDVDTGELFAVKRLFYNSENYQHTKFIADIEAEVNLLRELRHDNIVGYLGSEQVKDNFCIYLEYLPGGSVSSMHQRLGALPEKVVRKYIRQAVKGVAFLHSHGTLHRDIKGANLLVARDGTVKLSDFGCSKKYEDPVNQSEMLTSVRGSLPWMAPEVLKQSGYGRKADVWSIGCLTLEMLTGRQPWPAFDNHIEAIMKIAMSNDLPEIPDTLSAEAVSFISSCLQRNPKDRKTAEELLLHPFCL
eukprot:CAMPEP_0204910558 /NCGR_PEP_ID=MMETSP1397-20131031/9051_1 /ASSEMBLY_ACC=CAM_ASM_000891 /TAXON_ID=49980 /ORGANISM="Climacostomum Climacostomum virens, Strain Stock W-24" /LENGTH=380 /DNA_ID=CAMNT_0052080765 /DNA_START=176 /DNA_END=1318 /DNA_ORIENTATION=+